MRLPVGIAVLAVLALVWGNGPARAQSDDLARTLVSFGYRITSRDTPAPTEWEKSQFRLQSKRRYAVKKIKADGPYHLRFVVEEETYANEADAAARLLRVDELPPGVGDKSPEGVLVILREAFRRGAQVYTVSTDVNAFELNGDLRRMRERLEKAVAPPWRAVHNNLLVSAAQPKVKLKFEPQFKYAGAQTFLLYRRAQAEQHFFVQADAKKRIKRLYFVQFEGFLPNVAASYDEEKGKTARLGPDEYDAAGDFIPTEYALQQNPDSDAAQAATYLRRAGYQIPAHVAWQRFRRILAPERRNEVIILYLEDLADTGLTAADLAKGGRAYEQRNNMLEKLMQRAISGFKVMP